MQLQATGAYIPNNCSSVKPQSAAFSNATTAYLAELDRHTLASLLPEPAPRDGAVPITFHRKESQAA